MTITYTVNDWRGDSVPKYILDAIDTVVLDTIDRWNVNFEYETGDVELQDDGTYGFYFTIYSIAFRSENKRLCETLKVPFLSKFGRVGFVSIDTESGSGQEVDDPHSEDRYWQYDFVLILNPYWEND